MCNKGLRIPLKKLLMGQQWNGVTCKQNMHILNTQIDYKIHNPRFKQIHSKTKLRIQDIGGEKMCSNLGNLVVIQIQHEQTYAPC